MTSEENQEKVGPTQIVTLNKALKLAEQWVSSMSETTEDGETEREPEGQPSRLGLGAKVARQVKVGPLNDPIARNLQAKLESAKRKAAKDAEKSTPSTKNQQNNNDKDDSDEELESRTKAFAKKRAGPNNPPSLPLKKKQK